MAYTLEKSGEEKLEGSRPALSDEVEVAEMGASARDAMDDEPTDATKEPRAEQAFLVAFLADANPQVRTLAAWGLMSSDKEGEEGQQEILEFVREERDPEVRIALYRFLQGQKTLKCSTLVELVRQEEKDEKTWLASCDLLAGAVQSGANEETTAFFNESIVPSLKKRALNGSDLHCRIAAIIALRRSGTEEALNALQEITRTSEDPQVVQAASSAVRLAGVE